MYKFIKSSSAKENWYNKNNKEVCFVGRSNVGKSSLINALANQKIAKTSNTPGRTQLINFFENEHANIIVDLPGYGYAKMPKKAYDNMSRMIDEYFAERTQLIKTFVLIDTRVGLTQDDEQMMHYLKVMKRSFIVIGTKIDKANQSRQSKVVKEIKKWTEDIILVSSKKGVNIAKVRAAVKNIL